MTLRSRLAALERQIRRRQQRGYPVKPIMPRLKFDETDPQYIAVSAKISKLLADQPVRDRMQLTGSGGGPIQMQAEIGTARLILADADLAREVRVLIEKALAAGAASPVPQTGASGHE